MAHFAEMVERSRDGADRRRAICGGSLSPPEHAGLRLGSFLSHSPGGHPADGQPPGERLLRPPLAVIGSSLPQLHQFNSIADMSRLDHK